MIRVIPELTKEQYLYSAFLTHTSINSRRGWDALPRTLAKDRNSIVKCGMRDFFLYVPKKQVNNHSFIIPFHGVFYLIHKEPVVHLFKRSIKELKEQELEAKM